MKLNWQTIIEKAAEIVSEYNTRVTLRQLFYRLVAQNVAGFLNNMYCYKHLSLLTADARRDGSFPLLADTTRTVHWPFSFANVDEAREWLRRNYHRDRREEQKFQVWVIYEKSTLSEQIRAWVEPYGIPSAALRGYSSESLEREVWEPMLGDKRDVVAFYVGDLDPEGEDVERNWPSPITKFRKKQRGEKSAGDEILRSQSPIGPAILHPVPTASRVISA